MLPVFSSKSKLSLLFTFYSRNLFQLQLQYWVSCLDFILTKIKYFVRRRLHVNKPNEIGYFWMQQLRDHIWMQQLRLSSIRKTATTKVNFFILTMVYWALKMFLSVSATWFLSGTGFKYNVLCLRTPVLSPCYQLKKIVQATFEPENCLNQFGSNNG